MCKFAFGEFKGKVRVVDVEKRLGGVSFTIQTVEHLIDENPDCRFFLVLGSDTEKESPQWKDFDKIRDLVSFLSVPRGPTSFIPNVSSTDVRRNIRTGQRFTDMVTSEVAVYIVTKGLYEK
jgi:nicotinate-nucleotide adenylyltransferase